MQNNQGDQVEDKNVIINLLVGHFQQRWTNVHDVEDMNVPIITPLTSFDQNIAFTKPVIDEEVE